MSEDREVREILSRVHDEISLGANQNFGNYAEKFALRYAELAQSSQAERVKELEAENVRLKENNNILCRWKSEIDQRRIILELPFPVDYDDSPMYAVQSLIEALNQKGGE